MTFTHVVVGAGSAGCVVADALASRADGDVLLLEAGPGYHTDGLPAALSDGTTPAIGSHDWGVVAEGPRGLPVEIPRGRVVGGTSQVNSCIALWPEPGDFPGRHPHWAWDQIAGSLREIVSDEDDPQVAVDGNGRTIPIRRPDVSALTPLAGAFLRDCSEAGWPRVTDHNAPGTSGAGIVSLNVTPAGRRVSAADVFLADTNRAGRLTVVAGAHAQELMIESGVARGVRYLDEHQGPCEAVAPTIVLAAGVFGTPTLLLRSGIGPREELDRVGVTVRADVPGVGRGLHDHSQVPIVFRADGSPRDGVPCVQALARYTSDASPVRNDMQMCLIGHVDLPGYRPDLAERWSARLAASLTSNAMVSPIRGRVTLDDGGTARVEMHYGDHPDELRRHREGVRIARDFLTRGEMSGLVRGLDAPTDDVLSDEEALDTWILQRVQTGHHAMGTARMGDDSDQEAVVDPGLAVRGVPGLYVTDASVLPAPVRANTNLTVMAIARRAARLLP